MVSNLSSLFVTWNDPDLPNIKAKKSEFTEEEFNELKDNYENIHNLQDPFEKYYDVTNILGEGCSAIVKNCTRNSDGKNLAVKILNYFGDDEKLHMVSQKFFEEWSHLFKPFKKIVREFKFYSTLRHKNIVEMCELYIDFNKTKIYMVMELVKGFELFQLLDKGNPLTGILSRPKGV